jgi:hypothetical protein
LPYDESDQTFEALLKDFHSFIDILTSLTDSLYTKEIQVAGWKKYLEVLSVKLALNSSSLALLFEATPLRGRGIKFHDLPAIYLLRRAQIENYLMFFYLNIQPQSDTEGEFKFYLFEASGLNARQKYDVKQPESILKKQKELERLGEYVTKIRQNLFFQSLNLQKQNQLLSTLPAKTVGWEKLIESSPLKTGLFLDIWRLYSNHAHSEMIGLSQLKGYIKNPDSLSTSLRTTLVQSIWPLCVMIVDLARMDPYLQRELENQETHMVEKISYWYHVATE